MDEVDVYMEVTRRNDALVSGSETDIKRQVAEAVFRVIGVKPHVRFVECAKALLSGENTDNIFTKGNVTIVDKRKYEP